MKCLEFDVGENGQNVKANFKDGSPSPEHQALIIDLVEFSMTLIIVGSFRHNKAMNSSSTATSVIFLLECQHKYIKWHLNDLSGSDNATGSKL